MLTPITPAQIQDDPLRIATTISTPDGQPVTFRPLCEQDAAILGPYFLGLSEQTKYVYAPHAFDQAMADQLCASINYADTIRMIATLPGESGEQVIAYFILMLGVGNDETARYAQAGIDLDPAKDCLVAPSVADAFQSRGIGSPLMQHIFQVARRLGRRRVALMGGVYHANERAVHYYQKAGFHSIGTFTSPNNPGRPSYDMYLDL